MTYAVIRNPGERPYIAEVVEETKHIIIIRNVTGDERFVNKYLVIAQFSDEDAAQAAVSKAVEEHWPEIETAMTRVMDLEQKIEALEEIYDERVDAFHDAIREQRK